MKAIGKRFRTGNITFTVLEAENYPASRVSKRYHMILSFRPNLLVAVGFRGICIPNITYDKGVVRLTRVEVNGQVFNRPKDISEALGIKDPMVPYPLREM